MNLFYCKSELTERPDDVVCLVSKDNTLQLHLWGQRHKPIEFVQQQCDNRIYFGSIDIGKLTATVDGGIAMDGGGYVVLDNGKNRMLFDELKWLLNALYEMTPANRMFKVDAPLVEA